MSNPTKRECCELCRNPKHVGHIPCGFCLCHLPRKNYGEIKKVFEKADKADHDKMDTLAFQAYSETPQPSSFIEEKVIYKILEDFYAARKNEVVTNHTAYNNAIRQIRTALEDCRQKTIEEILKKLEYHIENVAQLYAGKTPYEALKAILHSLKNLP